MKTKILTNKKTFLNFLYLILFSTSLLAVTPNQLPVTVDGDISEWNLSQDYVTDLVNGNGTTYGKLYLRYDCVDQTVYVLVLPANGAEYIIYDNNTGEEVWVKENNSKILSSAYSSFAWVNLNGDEADGWEGSFSHEDGTFNILVHSNAWYQESQTIEATVQLTLACSYDFGDASGIASASAVVVPELVRLGDTVDSESTTQNGVAATGDDNNNTNDEDGVTFSGPAVLLIADVYHAEVGSEVTVNVTAVNNYTGSSVYLKGYFDFNQDGDFEDANEEILSVLVPSTTTNTYSVTFTIPEDALTDYLTYARFRISSTDVSSSGAGGVGEVEDYAFQFEESSTPVIVKLSSFEAIYENSKVTLTWIAESEVNHAGYNVYRSTSTLGQYEKINELLIKSEMSNSQVSNHYYEFVDYPGNNDTYYYKLEDVSLDGESTMHGPVQVAVLTGVLENGLTPTEFSLSPNYPNPFNPSTTISYSIPQSEKVVLEIFDLTGKQIRTLVSENQQAGQYSVIWDSRNEVGLQVTSGVYLYRIQAGAFNATGRMTLIK